MVTSDRCNKDAGQIAQTTLDKLATAQRNDCVRPLRCGAQNASRGIIPVALISWVTSLTPNAGENT